MSDASPKNPDGGQAWLIHATSAERWALTNIFLSETVSKVIAGKDARKHRRLRDALHLNHVIDSAKNSFGVAVTKANGQVIDICYNLTVENLEWFDALMQLIPTGLPTELLVAADALLERCQDAKAGTYALPAGLASWSASLDDWTPPKTLEPEARVCPSCKQASHPSEWKDA